MDVGQLIANARIKTGLTQTELAGRMGTHQSVVARWETGKTQPSLETVIRAVEAAGLELKVAISDPNPNQSDKRLPNRTTDPTRLIQELHQMNADQNRLRWIKGR